MKTIITFFLVILFNLTFYNLVLAQVDVTPNPQTYTTLYAAFNAINTGVHTNGVINITITANVTEILQARLNGGVFTSCTIMPSANVTISSNINIPVIFLNGADNVTIDGRIGGVGSANSLTIRNYRNSVSYPNVACVSFNNGACNNILRYVNCKASSALTASSWPIYIGLSSPGTSGNNNNIIEYCNIQGGITGINCTGTSGVYPFTNDNNIIKNNRIKNATKFGIYLGSYVNNITCDNNEIFFDSAVTTMGIFHGIQLQSTGTISVRNNRMYGFDIAAGTSTEFDAVVLCPNTDTQIFTVPVTNVDIINNNIALSPNSTNEVVGIYIQSSNNPNLQWTPFTANVYNNTIEIGGTTTGNYSSLTAGIFSLYVPGLMTNNYVINTFNNILINRREGTNTSSSNIGLKYDVSNLYYTVNSDYNNCYASNPVNGFAAVIGNSIYRNSELELFKRNTCEIGIEQHTVFKNVNFVSSSNLHLAGPIGGDMCGKPLATVTNDIDGTPRNSLYPYRGCDEGAPLKILSFGAKLQNVSLSEGIKIALVNSSCQVVSTCYGDLSSGAAIFCFGDSIINGTGYYLDIKSRSHLRTYSASLQNFTGDNLVYDFKTSSSQAYGFNMILDGSEYAFYGGDVNQDGIIDGVDGLFIDNDAAVFVTGCNLSTDINNDGIVDGSDTVIQDNNALNFVSENIPCF